MSYFGTRTPSARFEDVERKWYIIDADGKTLGRMCTEVAKLLRGKEKTNFTPNVDTGDHVIVINSDKIKVTGNKLIDKKYYWKPRWFGSMREMTTEQLIGKDSTELIERAVTNMLPRGPLGRQIITKLNVYKNGEHPHQAQRPQPYNI